MAEIKTTETKKTCAKKTCATKSTAKATTAKKAPVKKTAAKAIVYVDQQNAGFKAGDIYQILSTAEQPLTVAELAKLAKTTAEDVCLGLGWLLREGKVAATEDNKIVLA